MPVPVDETEEPVLTAVDPARRNAPDRAAPARESGTTAATGTSGATETADRWPWRQRIRADPRKRAVYRFLVGLVGGLFIVAGLVTGPLPGPGGIPLVLLGLAVWASEFGWAHRLMTWFKDLLHRFRPWSRPRQVLFWVGFFACCALLGWLYLVVLGVPGWLPVAAAGRLQQLPGV